MKILVLGGTRFFGIPMLEKLIEGGHDVTVATRGLSRNPFENSTEQLLMDRTDYDSVRHTLAGKEYDLIIDKIAYCSNDVRNLLENVRCKKYIQMSSCSVYSEDKLNISESAFDPSGHKLVWMNRTEDYAEGKRQAESAALEYMDETGCVFVRYPVVMGENDYTGRLKFYVDHIAAGKPIYVDNPDFGMQFIHEKEAGHFLAYLAGKDVYGAINGASKNMISSGDIVGFIEKVIGKKAIISPDGDAAPYNGSRADISYDTRKAESIGFHFSDINDWIYGLIKQLTERELWD